MKEKEEELREAMKTWQNLMLQVPNVPDISVPEGDSDADNQEVVQTRSKGSLTGLASETTMGVFAIALLGTETSQAAHAGETVVYDHVFDIDETAQKLKELEGNTVAFTMGAGDVYKAGEAALK